eukprot:gene37237-46286_t
MSVGARRGPGFCRGATATNTRLAGMGPSSDGAAADGGALLPAARAAAAAAAAALRAIEELPRETEDGDEADAAGAAACAVAAADAAAAAAAAARARADAAERESHKGGLCAGLRRLREATGHLHFVEGSVGAAAGAAPAPRDAATSPSLHRYGEEEDRVMCRGVDDDRWLDGIVTHVVDGRPRVTTPFDASDGEGSFWDQIEPAPLESWFWDHHDADEEEALQQEEEEKEEEDHDGVGAAPAGGGAQGSSQHVCCRFLEDGCRFGFGGRCRYGVHRRDDALPCSKVRRRCRAHARRNAEAGAGFGTRP